jgi:hypothetical protein
MFEAVCVEERSSVAYNTSSIPSARIVVNVIDDNMNWKHSKVEGLRKIIRGPNENRHPWNSISHALEFYLAKLELIFRSK